MLRGQLYDQVLTSTIDAIKSKQEKDYPPSTYLLIAFNYFYISEESLVDIGEKIKGETEIKWNYFENIFLVSGLPPIILNLESLELHIVSK